MAQRAAAALPDSLLLQFAAADAEEAAGGAALARQRYEALVERLAKADAAAAASASSSPADATSPPMSDRLALAWIQFMRFCRRGENVESFRRCFLKAKDSAGGCQWRVFAAAAQVEWAWDGNDKVARKVFELGMRTFSNDADYVLAYGAWLESVNDATNFRLLFERVLGAAAGSAAAAQAALPQPMVAGGAVAVPAAAAGAAGAAAAVAAAPAAPPKPLSKVAQLRLWDALVAFESARGSLEQAREKRRESRVALILALLCC